MNTPNILSNQLDQAPKTHEANYQNRLEEIKNDIEEALDQLSIKGDETLENWFSENGNSLPLAKINELQDGQSLALEIKRSKHENRGGRNEAPSMPTAPENSLFLNAQHKLSKNTTPLQAGEKAIYLLITKEHSDPKFPHNKNYQLKAVEFAIPGENTLLSKGFIFEKELAGEDFTNAIA